MWSPAELRTIEILIGVMYPFLRAAHKIMFFLSHFTVKVKISSKLVTYGSSAEESYIFCLQLEDLQQV